MYEGRLWSKRGLALIELLVAMTMFTVVLGLCLFAAVTGFRMFGQTNIRYRLQRDGNAVFAWLRKDIESTNLLKCKVVERTSGTERRDSLGVVGLDSWQEPINLTSHGEPNWNRLVLYTATRDPGSGQLLRQVHSPSPADVPLTFVDIEFVMPRILDGSESVFDQRRLAGGIVNFAVNRSLIDQSLHFTVKLSQSSVESGAGRPRAEVLELQTAIHPRNTIPKI